MTRRDFLQGSVLGAAGLALAGPPNSPAAAQDAQPTKRGASSYPYRIAFGAWLNDLRATPLPLENWPAPQLDDEAVESAIRALEGRPVAPAIDAPIKLLQQADIK